MIRLRSRTVSCYIIASNKKFLNLLGCLKVHSRRSRFYERNFVNVSVVFNRSYLQNLPKNKLFHELTKNGLKKATCNTFMWKLYLIDFFLFLRF